MPKLLSRLAGSITFLLLFISLFGSYATAQTAQVNPEQRSKYFIAQTIMLGNGISLEKNIINGPPTPPPGYELERTAVSLPEPDQEMAVKTLTVPAYNWVFGCSAVSGAMIAAYYDINGFPNMYTGSTNGGVMPLDSSTWGTWSDGSATYPRNPLVASQNGLDGRITRGSIDDYWVAYNSAVQDPYITNGWTQHTWGDAIGDYMKTSQSANGNVDGSTTFYNYTSSATPLTCSDMVTYGIQTLDGTYGRKLFYEAKGYTVTDCYSQKTDNTVTGGFSLAQFKAEIDADRPVMLNLEGHTIVGVGYDNASNTVYIHDTWDYLNHTMTWGTSYSGMALLSVSVVNLASTTSTTTTAPACIDNDGDTYGTDCPAGPDCDDTKSAVNPGATEVCNTIDDDCDGSTDEGCTTWYQDADGDGYGNAASTTQAVTQPVGYVSVAGDCDDTSATKHLVDPNLSAPAGTNIVPRPDFIWENKSPGTVQWYSISVYSAVGAGGYAAYQWFDPASVCSGAFCTTKLTNALWPGTYYWWLNTWGDNSCGFNVQPGGKYMQFTVTGCEGPVLVSPISGTVAFGANPNHVFTSTTAEWINLCIYSSAYGVVSSQWANAGDVCTLGNCSVAPARWIMALGQNWWWLNTWSTQCGFQVQPGGNLGSYTIIP